MSSHRAANTVACNPGKRNVKRDLTDLSNCDAGTELQSHGVEPLIARLVDLAQDGESGARTRRTRRAVDEELAVVTGPAAAASVAVAVATAPMLALNHDVLSVLYTHLEVPLTLKLVCRTTRAAAPAKTKTPLSAVVSRVALLEWAREHGCPWNEYTCAYAAEGGQLAVLQWAREHGCPWDEATCAMAAKGGHLAVLQWARANGCHWSTYTCTCAAGGGHLAVLQWARAHGCPS